MNHTEDILVESFTLRPTSLRVALVTETFPPEVNGVAMTLNRLVEGLVQRGHTVQMVRPRQTITDVPRQHNGVDEVLATGVPIPNYGGLKFGLPLGKRLEALWNQHRPDVVHVATEGPLGWSAVTAARRLKLPVTSSFHTNFHSYSRHYGMALLKTPIAAYLRKLHNRTQATLVPTRALGAELVRLGYHNVRVMSRGVATTQFSPAKRDRMLRASWNATDEDVVVIYVGRVAKEKNMGLLLSAFAAIKAKAPTAKLVVVGDGPLRQSVCDACPTAIFTGVQQGEQLAVHYASADLFLFPSLTETFGNVVPEALASGLGVVAYAQAAAAELIQDGYCGRTLSSGDEFGFINAAVALATNPGELLRMRLQAPGSVSHMAWSSVQESFIKTLQDVISAGSGVNVDAQHMPQVKPL